jgi:hypothetical protein
MGSDAAKSGAKYLLFKNFDKILTAGFFLV